MGECQIKVKGEHKEPTRLTNVSTCERAGATCLTTDLELELPTSNFHVNQSSVKGLIVLVKSQQVPPHV